MQKKFSTWTTKFVYQSCFEYSHIVSVLQKNLKPLSAVTNIVTRLLYFFLNTVVQYVQYVQYNS